MSGVIPEEVMVALIKEASAARKVELSLQEIVENKIREKDEQPGKSKNKEKAKRRLIYLEEHMIRYIASQLVHSRMNFFAPGYAIALQELAPLVGISFPVINQMELGRSSLDSCSNLMSLLAILSKAPSGVVPLMPKGNPPWTTNGYLEPSKIPMTPMNFMTLFRIRSSVEIDAISYKYGIKSAKEDWSDWESIHMSKKSKKSVNNGEYECTATKERFIELIKSYALDRNLSFKSAIKQLSLNTNVPERTLNDICNPDVAFDTDRLTMRQAVMLCGNLPHPEGIIWEHIKFVEYITMKKMRPFGELGITIDESTRKTLDEMTQ